MNTQSVESPMKVSALAPWFGAKRNMAQIIIAELGPHAAYWEPFCGSMAIFLAKESASFETVNDLHADLINLARCLRDRLHGPALYRRLRRALACHADFIECREKCRSYPTEPIEVADPEWAYNYFLTSWQGMNGMAGTMRYNLGFARRLTKNGGHAGKRFSSVVESIPAFRRRLRNVTILSCDGIKLCEEIEDADGVVVYVDPPYIVKGAQYVHDFTGQDHVCLAKVLGRFKRTRVVVSYYADPQLQSLYRSWTFVDCARTKSLVSQGRRGKENDTVAPEVLIINGPSMAPDNLRQGVLFGVPASGAAGKEENSEHQTRFLC